jgi:hypothetical protein
MQTRRAFIPVGRLIAYVLALVVVAGVWVAFQKLREKNEIGPDETAQIQLAGPAPGELSRYLADQHRSASANPKGLEGTGARSETNSDPSQLSEWTATWLGSRKTLEDLFEGRAAPSFLGVRKSAVPGPGPSVQLLFKTDAPGDAAMASLFLKRYMQAPVMEDGAAYSLKSGSVEILIWRHTGLVYDLVGTPAAVESLRKAMGAPTPAGEYTGK